uniref:CHHC U11-48K-type domain-containing protein n=2 Tax=Drosophila melanogaster TaxID=7227 RepID=Q8IR64_DROME|nr:uncharacterized protein Dmel_CG32625 [Drosophila melanogaster]AAN09336.1 uncharacterized protein Dmel_CG32625 [Drosophila melanogaster]|eukprot:NP_727732.1 uncharacterized protein Dmel_CG32625 [Drosophila melanogaster]
MSADPKLYEYVNCPNSSSHLVMLFKMPYHLPLCAKKFPSDELARCPYNRTHMYPIADIYEHIIKCPSYLREESHSDAKEDAKDCDAKESDAKDWDADPPVSTYDPNIHCEKNPIIRRLHGATRSSRRAFREKERKRLMDLNTFP